MEPVENSPALWDALWERNDSGHEADRYDLAKEEASVRWRRMEERICANFGSFKGLEVIEIGAGRGTNGALMARRGAHVSVLDYSEIALASARKFFERNGVNANYILADALNLEDAATSNRFDVSMSFGLAEHFKSAARHQIVDAHFKVLKPGGMTFISVPNAFNPPYRMYKFVAERTGKWHVGEEIPFTRGELAKICKKLGYPEFDFFGDSFADSFRFINPVAIMSKVFRRTRTRPPIRLERGSRLDAYLAYALILSAEKARAEA
jgi:cyclopropane fatty-acyl-phospholipid synthase-like methyltransferase